MLNWNLQKDVASNEMPTMGGSWKGRVQSSMLPGHRASKGSPNLLLFETHRVNSDQPRVLSLIYFTKAS